MLDTTAVASGIRTVKSGAAIGERNVTELFDLEILATFFAAQYLPISLSFIQIV